jgi:putative toxin-antitoxin system antitoxin component (TIGR02293 family)
MIVYMASPAKALRSAGFSAKTVRFTRAGESMGMPAHGVSEQIRGVMRGFPYKSLTTFAANFGVSPNILAQSLGIPDRTLARRRAAGRLAPDESERLLRLASIFEKTVALFEGDSLAAVQWLSTPKRALENQAPLKYARTEVGAREVENLIGRLEYGVFS